MPTAVTWTTRAIVTDASGNVTSDTTTTSTETFDDANAAADAAAQAAFIKPSSDYLAKAHADAWLASDVPGATVRAIASTPIDPARIAADYASQAAAEAMPRYVSGTGQFVRMDSGALLSMDANGAVYNDGVVMPGIAAAMLCTFHGKVFGKGKTVPSWWQWNGINWGAAALDPSKLDPQIFK
jgi:hypothetical protein